MAALKPVIRPDKKDSTGKSRIYIRVSHARKTRYISTPYSADAHYMGTDGYIKPSHAGHTSLNLAIHNLISKYTGIIISMDSRVRDMSMEDLLVKLRQDSGGDFLKYAGMRVKSLLNEGRVSLSESCRLTIDHVKTYSRKQELQFREITPSFLHGLELYLRRKGCKPNTIGVYMRNIRSVFNRAIDDGSARQELYPFRRYKIPQEMTIKRSLSVNQLRRLWVYRYEDTGIPRHHSWAVDMFFLSFFLIGINIKDMLYLERKNYIGDRVYYNRAKTSKQYSVRLISEALEIISLYKGEKYLLDVIERKEAIKGKRKRDDLHKDVIGYFNRYLKDVAREVGIPVPISSYYARHSWATIAASLDVSKDVIAYALGHGGNTVTDIYIDFDLKKVDQANRQVANTIIASS